jgi:hypothetical protein
MMAVASFGWDAGHTSFTVRWRTCNRNLAPDDCWLLEIGGK